MKKRLVAGLLVGLSVLIFLAGCAKRPEGPGQKKINLSFADWEVTPQQLALWSKVVKEFNQTHPGINVKLEPVSGGTQPIIIRIAGGMAPDIFFWDSHILAPLIQKKAVVNLTPFIKKDKINPKKFFRSAWQGVVFAKKIYGLPPYWGAEAIAYNKTLFDKSGVPYPQDNWTWQDYLNMAKKLTRKKKGRIIQFGAVPPQLGTAMLSFGGAWFDRQGHFSGDTPQVKAALSFIQDMRYKYKVSPPMSQLGTMSESYRQEMELFMTGRLAMFSASSWTLPVLKEIKSFRWDVAPLPRKGKEKRRIEEAAAILLISTQSKHPGAAWEFVKFATYGGGTKILARGGNAVPALKEAAKEYFLPPPDHIKVFYTQTEGRESVFSPARFTWYPEWKQTILTPERDKLLLDLETPQEMINNLKKKTADFLSKQ